MSEHPADTLALRPPKGRIADNFVYLAGGQIISAVLGIIVTASLGRMLGASNYGLYFVIVTLVGVVATVADWGQSNYVLREVSRGRPDRAQFIGSAAAFRFIATFLSAGVAVAIAVMSGYSTLVVVLTGLVVLTGYPASFVLFFGYVMRAVDRTDVDVIGGLLAKALGTIALVVGLWLGGGLVVATLVPALGGLVALLYSLRMFRRTGLTMARPAPKLMREILFAGAPLVMMSLTVVIHGLIDVTLLSTLTSPEVVGWLGATKAFLGILISPATILATASFPELCRVCDSRVELRQILSASARPLLATGALASCGVFILAQPAVQLVYGSHHFDPAALALQVFAPFFPIFFLNFLMGYTAIAIGKSTQIAVAKAVCVAISAVMSWFLIPYFQTGLGNGVVGLMISYCASEVLMTIAYVAILSRDMITLETLGHMARAYLSAGIVVIVGGELAPMVPLWIAFPLVPALFAIVALITGLLRLSDLETMLAMTRSIIDRTAKSAK